MNDVLFTLNEHQFEPSSPFKFLLTTIALVRYSYPSEIHTCKTEMKAPWGSTRIEDLHIGCPRYSLSLLSRTVNLIINYLGQSRWRDAIQITTWVTNLSSEAKTCIRHRRRRRPNLVATAEVKCCSYASPNPHKMLLSRRYPISFLKSQQNTQHSAS